MCGSRDCGGLRKVPCFLDRRKAELEAAIPDASLLSSGRPKGSAATLAQRSSPQEHPGGRVTNKPKLPKAVQPSAERNKQGETNE